MTPLSWASEDPLEPPEGSAADAEFLGAALMTAFSKDMAKEAQTAEMPGAPDFTMRDFANALVVATFRNGFIEELHAGAWSPLTTDRSLSRITDEEMKKLCLEMSARLAQLLHIYLRTPQVFAAHMDLRLMPFVKRWDREALGYELPPVHDEVAKCSSCGTSIVLEAWRFCPGCGSAR